MAAGRLLRWRPIGILRDEKIYPNSERNLWSIVEALVNCVSDAEIVARLGAH